MAVLVDLEAPLSTIAEQLADSTPREFNALIERIRNTHGDTVAARLALGGADDGGVQVIYDYTAPSTVGVDTRSQATTGSTQGGAGGDPTGLDVGRFRHLLISIFSPAGVTPTLWEVIPGVVPVSLGLVTLGAVTNAGFGWGPGCGGGSSGLSFAAPLPPRIAVTAPSPGSFTVRLRIIGRR